MKELIIVLTVILSLAVIAAAVYLFMIFPSIKKPKAAKSLHSALYAHRGYHNREIGIPENTMAAFQRAVDMGYGMEFDLRLSKDKQVVIMHDNSLKRMCGKDILVSQSDYCHIRDIKVGNSDQTIPLFDDLLKLVKGRVPLLVELKSEGGDHDELCEAVFKLLDLYEGEYSVESFDPRVLRWLKKNRPAVVRGQLACHMSTKSSHGKKAILLRNLMFNYMSRPHFVAYRFGDRGNISFRLNRLLGADIYFWTLRDRESAELALKEKGALIFENIDANELMKAT